jgi:RimJ/RimL family protein N-acetyltransferase
MIITQGILIPMDIPDDFFQSIQTGPRLILRPYDEVRDFDNIAQIFSDPRITGPIGIPFPDPFLEHLRQAKRERVGLPDAGEWSVFEPSENGEIFVGEVGVSEWERENQIVELFSAINSDFGGKGYGRESVSILMSQIFTHVPIVTIRMQTLATNERALALCRSLGFHRTGERYLDSDLCRGFVGGMAIILDCRLAEFIPING